MVRAAIRFLPIGIKAAKILQAIAVRITEATPQEREALGRHLIAIYNLLKGVAERRQETSRLPPLPMLPAPQGWNEPQSGQNDGMQERFRRSMQQFGQTTRKYKRNFTAEERRELIAHLDEIKKILSDIERRVQTK